ncbi:MAG: hypothetical protein AAFQ36_11570 [Pseudomonadota bacterium]
MTRLLLSAAAVAVFATTAYAGPRPVVIGPIKVGPVLEDGTIWRFTGIPEDQAGGPGAVTITGGGEFAETLPGVTVGERRQPPGVRMPGLQPTRPGAPGLAGPRLSNDISPELGLQALSRIERLQNKVPASSPHQTELLILAEAVIAKLPLDQQSAARLRFGLTE